MSKGASATSLGRLAALFGLMLGLLVTTTWFSISNFHKLIEADHRNVHTYRVLLSGGEMLESVVAMDTGARSFLTQGKEAVLATYSQGQASFDEHFQDAGALSYDRAEQQQRLKTLRAQLEAWQSLLVPVFRVRRSIRDNARSLAITTRSASERTQAMNRIRLTIEAFQNYEEDELRSRAWRQEKFQQDTNRTMLLGGAFSLALAAGLCALVLSNTHALNRSNIGMERANRGLARANDELALAFRDLEAQTRQLEAARSQLEARRDELARSNAELEQFAYVASHDLQEPLRAVAGCVQVLQKRYSGQLDARADQFIQHAVDGAQRMQNLIHDLLLFSRVGTRGKEFEPTDLGSILKRARENLSVATRESHAIITADEMPTLPCDAGQIEQVMQNFLANALKFRRPSESTDESSGEKTLLPPVIHIGASRDAERGEWRISVRDNGPGIEPKYFERIWIMFQRLHTRTEYAGTGIGLAVCKKVIERHGGQVGVDSHTSGAEQGSTFWFTLPERAAVAPEAVAPLASDGASSDGGSST